MTIENDNFFQTAIKQVLKNEGGFVNNPQDKGGETMYGITAKTTKACGYNGKMCDLPKEKAASIYFENYWKKSGVNQIEFLGAV